jgi:hypothetical protein
MATVVFTQAATMLNPSIWYGVVTVATSTQVSLNNYAGSSATYYGNNFSYSGSTVTGGTITSYDNFRGYSLDYTVRNASVDAKTLASLTNSGNAAGAQSFALSGNDAITGSNFSDTLLAYSGDDHINGGGGNDYIDGGDGTDTAYFFNPLSSHTVSFQSGKAIITGSQGTDTLVAVENFNFSGRNYTLSELQSFDNTAPQISSFSPTDGATGIKVNSNIIFSFNEPIQKGSGFINIRTDSATGALIESFDISNSAKVTISGNNLTIDPSALSEGKTYFVTIGSGVVKDLSGNNYSGISTYDFKTVRSIDDHLFSAGGGYGIRYETSDIRVPGTVISGTLGDDDLYGTPGVDYVAGYRGLDVIMTYGGNDVIFPSINKSSGDVGDGIDTLVIGRTLANSTIEPYLFQNPSAELAKGVSVDSKLDTNVFSNFNNVERLQFLDTNIALDIAPNQNAGSVYMIYKAAFNRSPDQSGMGYWLAQKDNGSNIVTDIAQGFVGSAEFTAKYGTNPTNAAYVDKLYQNVLGRAGDAGGVAYWNQQLDAGNISKAATLVAFATLAEGASIVAPLIANGIPYTEWVG